MLKINKNAEIFITKSVHIFSCIHVTAVTISLRETQKHNLLTWLEKNLMEKMEPQDYEKH